MLASGDAAHALDERRPRLSLCGQHAAAFDRHLIEAAAALVGLFDPGALDPATLFESIEQGVERIDVEGQRAAGPGVDQLAQLVAVPRPRVEQREDEQFGGAALELAIERAGIDT